MTICLQISAGRTHSAAWTSAPPPQRAPGSPSPIQLGVPAAVPPQYAALRDVPIPALRARLRLLHHFSDLIYSVWRLLRLTPQQVSDTQGTPWSEPRKEFSLLIKRGEICWTVLLTLRNMFLLQSEEPCGKFNSGSSGLVQGVLRNLLAPRVYTLPMVRSIGKTMVQGKNYGPQITVKRLATR